MEKKILLLFLYIGLLFFIKNQGLMKVQQNTGFYIDHIDLDKDDMLESMICQEEVFLKYQKRTTF